MNTTAIRVEKLSKMYRIGAKEQQPQTRAGLFKRAAISPIAYLRRTLTPPIEEEIFWALRDISFEVKRGEAVGIIGPNGAGKSTLLKILSRITEPTSGRAVITGRVGSLLEVGTGFHPELTGRENIYLNAAIMGMRRNEIQRKFDEIVDFSGVEKFIDTPVKHYSSGMYVRLAFAVAAHLQPDILIVDEVLSVGDAAFQKKCLGKIGDVAQEGQTVLLVSHNMTAIKALCARSILLENGTLSSYGETAKVVMDYLQEALLPIAEKEWADPLLAPGNDMVRLKSARVVPLTKAGCITVHTPVDICFEFWSFQERGGVLNLSLVLYTREDICVLNTVSAKTICHKGIIKGVCHIPGNFLNDETYRIRILVVQEATAIFEDTNILSFEVLEGTRDGQWYGKRIGVVRPKLDWELEYAQ